jgi:serine protease Do
MRLGIYRNIAAVSIIATGLVTMPAIAQTQRRAHSATAHGIATPGYLGVGVAELTDDRVKALHLKDDRGLEVKHIEDNSPAAKAGLKENDVILEVNGKGVESIQQFQTSIGEMAPGTKVNLTIWRSGAKQTMTATLDSRPGNFLVFGSPDFPDAPMPPMPPVPFGGSNVFPAMPGNSPMVGFEGESLSPQLAEYFGVKEGVLVRTVNPNTPAQRAGLKAGDVVTKVNGTPVMSPREITGLVHSTGKKAISFTVVRNKKEITLNVEITSNPSGSSEREAL